MISVDEALERILDRAAPLGAEAIPVTRAAGRVLAAPLVARLDNPPFDASAMDGYALRATDGVAGASLRLIGVAQAGAPFGGAVGPGEAVRIFTGAPVPMGADAVLIQEETVADGERVALKSTVAPGQAIRAHGRDFSAGEEALPSGTLLTPFALALAAACGGEIVVAKRPRIALISTGDELVIPGAIPGPAQIVASNALALTPLLAPYASVADLGIVADEAAALAKALAGALEVANIVVTIGGASVGDRDFVNPVLQRLGVEIGFWKIAMRPGKPLMFGTKGKKLVFGLPGNPVSALVTAVVMVLPALRQIAGLPNPFGVRMCVPLAASIPANGIRRHFLRGGLGADERGVAQVSPFSETDSAHLSSLARADALIVQMESDPGKAAGELVEVIPLAAL